jgi:hypothetical protein
VIAACEATAPCRVDLSAAGPAIVVAIDRRAWCRVEKGADGVVLESKDLLLRLQAASVGELPAASSSALALAREALRALGVERGVRVATQVKVPASSGLGGETALAVALVGAVARAVGSDLGRGDLARAAAGAFAAALGRAAAPADVAAALYGGCFAEEGGAAAAVSVDPAALEECLRLVEVGSAPGASPPPPTGEPDGHGARVRAALAERRFEELAAALADDWDARCRVPGWATAERARVGSALRPAGAGLRACGGGEGAVVAVVAPPGPRGPGHREAVLAAAREAGLRLFPARVDVLGLDVEKMG